MTVREFEAAGCCCGLGLVVANGGAAVGFWDRRHAFCLRDASTAGKAPSGAT